VKITRTPFDGLFILEPISYKDSRGFFFESYNKKVFLDLGIAMEFVQDNQSHSKKNVLRGLHYQKPPFGQAKLVRVLSGSVQDVVVDLRKSQSTFGEHFSIDLSADNQKQILIPAGFAHGFLVLSEHADVIYKCDQYYNPQSDTGIFHADTDLAIKWKADPGAIITSEKDARLPRFSETDFFGF